MKYSKTTKDHRKFIYLNKAAPDISFPLKSFPYFRLWKQMRISNKII